MLFSLESVSRVSMATHSLGNPPSSSRWGDDAAACLCRVSCSPLCEPIQVVHLFPSDGAEQMMLQKCHALSENKMPPDCCRESWFYSPVKGQSLNQMKHKLEHFDGVAILRSSLHNRDCSKVLFFNMPESCTSVNFWMNIPSPLETWGTHFKVQCFKRLHLVHYLNPLPFLIPMFN